MTDIGGIAAERLQSFIERIEHVQEEIDALNRDKRDIYAEAKGNGFDKKILQQIVRLRNLDKEDRQEQEHLLDLYKAALGMD